METLITVVHIVVALFMILVVLVQGGNSGGAAAALGGGSNTSSAFGAKGTNTLLSRLTFIMAGLFMVTTISLTIIKSDDGEIGLKEKLQQQSEESGMGVADPEPASVKADEKPASSDQAPAE